MYLEIENKIFDILIVDVHASWKILRINKKIFFYGKIQNEFAKIPRHDVKIVIDDFNAKIRKKNALSYQQLRNLDYMIYAVKIE